MEAGLQVLNDSGILQIDSKYKNPILYASGTVTATQNYITSVLRYIDIPSGRAFSIIALESPAGAWFSVLNYFSGGLVVHRVFTYGPASVNYWLFSNQIPGGSTFGLEVFDAAGIRVFQGTEKYMSVIPSVNSGAIVSQDNPTPSYIMDAGRPNFVVVIASRPVSKNTIAIPRPDGSIMYAFARTCVLCRIQGNQAQFGMANYSSGTGAAGFERLSPLSVLLLDKNRLAS